MRVFWRFGSVLTLVASVALAQEPARPKPDAEQTHRLHWRWRRAGVVDYAAIAALGGAYLYMEFGASQGTEPRWTKPILFDDGARDALRARSPEGRQRAARASDYAAIVAPAVAIVDTFVIPLADNGNWDVAFQLSVIDLEAAAVTGLLTRGGNRIARRARPDNGECEKDPNYDALCFAGATASFPSGHTSTAFTAAGLVCAHHLNLPLYGGGAPDVAACATTTTFALATGTLRLVADRHWTSDVLVGAAIGASAGFALPMLATYAYETAGVDSARVFLTPLQVADGFGLGARGSF